MKKGGKLIKNAKVTRVIKDANNNMTGLVYVKDGQEVRVDGDYVISLEIKGKSFTSEHLAEHIEKLGIDGRSTVDFVIGGSLGLSAEVSRRADLKLSFSAMTFPHQMMRVILLEQIYRSFKIIRHETYHK